MNTEKTPQPVDGEKILRMFADGKTPTEIAGELGCARSLVAYHLKRGENDDVELDKLLDEQWNRLPVLEKIGLLL